MPSHDHLLSINIKEQVAISVIHMRVLALAVGISDQFPYSSRQDLELIFPADG
jgi:hypothetical protein